MQRDAHTSSSSFCKQYRLLLLDPGVQYPILSYMGYKGTEFGEDVREQGREEESIRTSIVLHRQANLTIIRYNLRY